jgi:type IV secretory pathway TrbD component
VKQSAQDWLACGVQLIVHLVEKVAVQRGNRRDPGGAQRYRNERQDRGNQPQP